MRRFHSALATAGVAGFIDSRSYRSGVGYADWYVVSSSSALDALNEAAVSGDRSDSHQFLARLAEDGSGKLFSLAEGQWDADASFEIRLSKPVGMQYGQLYTRLQEWTRRPGVALWRRMMVLGPPPEFSMLARERLELPDEMRPEIVPRQQI